MSTLLRRELRAAANDWLQRGAGPTSDAPDRRPALTIRPFRGIRHLTAAVSPDCSYQLVRDALALAQHEICIYIYNATAEHLLDLLRSAKQRGVRVRLMYDVMDTRGDERRKLAELGIELQIAPSSGARRVFTFCHQKFVVIDGSILMIGSANWANTSIPLVTTPGSYKNGNREWLIRIDDAPLAHWFQELFEADWNIPAAEIRAIEPPVEPPPPLLRAPAARPAKVFECTQLKLTKSAIVTPVISPENYFRLVSRLIRLAKTSIDIEQQYILASGPRTEALLAALQRRKDDLTIRIIVSPAFRKAGAKDNWELSVESLDAYGLKDRLRAMDLRYCTHLHNKGLIIDRRKVIVSSTNWSENSICRAREAGVVIDSPVVAEYFAQVFDLDWSTAISPNAPAMLPRGFISADPDAVPIHPADLV